VGGEPSSGRLEFSFGSDVSAIAIENLMFQVGMLAEQCDDFGGRYP